MTVIFTLMVRKLLLNVIIVVGPLALVAMVLPNTEKFFKIWYNNFIKLGCFLFF